MLLVMRQLESFYSTWGRISDEKSQLCLDAQLFPEYRPIGLSRNQARMKTSVEQDQYSLLASFVFSRIGN